METGVAGLTVGGGGGSVAGKIHELQVAQQVLDGDDQLGGSDNGAGGARSMSGSGSLAATRWTQNTGSCNGSAC
jgi:hypothetical protein